MPATCTHIKDHIKKVKPHTKGCEECLKTRRHLGPSAHVPGVRPRGLLRFVEESPRPRALPHHAAPDHSIRRARRRLALVLRRRHVSRSATRPARLRSSSCRFELHDLEAADLADLERFGLCAQERAHCPSSALSAWRTARKDRPWPVRLRLRSRQWRPAASTAGGTNALAQFDQRGRLFHHAT